MTPGLSPVTEGLPTKSFHPICELSPPKFYNSNKYHSEQGDPMCNFREQGDFIFVSHLAATCLLSCDEDAKRFNSKEKSVFNISRRVLGVLATTTFHTCSAACRTIRATSDRSIYRPAKTRFRLSSPKVSVITWMKERANLLNLLNLVFKLIISELCYLYSVRM